MAGDDASVTAPLLPPPPVLPPYSNGGYHAGYSVGAAVTSMEQRGRSWYQYIREQSLSIKKDCVVLFYALQDPRTSWYIKLMPIICLSYALSPLDLIPDCIPILGLLDDMVIVPALIWLAVKLIPEPVLADARRRAEHEPTLLEPNWVIAFFIFLIWVFCLEAAAYSLLTRLSKQYTMLAHWIGTTMLTLLFMALLVYVLYVWQHSIRHREFKQRFEAGLREARESMAARSATAQAV